MLVSIALAFEKGYIAHPYWPAREKLITIQKESGINRARSQEKRDKTLGAYLEAKGLTLDYYRALERDAGRPFYTTEDGEIVVPAHQLHGLVGQAAALAPSSVRLAKAEQIRTLLSFEDLRTGRYKHDGTWERFVPVKNGTGQILSNQRSLRVDDYLSSFTATGVLALVNEELLAKAKLFLAWAGHEIGVGAARKMGWGRFELARWEPHRA